MLYSFDIFDTIITRDTATPRGIFALMQERLLMDPEYQAFNGFIRRNFYTLRIQAESLAGYSCRGNGIEDITLEQIYEALSTTGGVTADERRLLMELEKETELIHIQGIRQNIDRILKLWERGERVVLISNMYLDAETVKELLRKVEPALETIPVYVSSESKKIKNTGSLYRYVKECENVEFDCWHHTGDDERADVEAPGRLGIHTERYPFEELLPWERTRMEEQEDNTFWQLTIGAARNARRKRPDDKRREGINSAAYRIGSSIGGGILFPYIRWVLEESRRKGLRRLFFIARDGYVLKQIADRIIRSKGLEIETFYLYGSREAWRMPAFISGRRSLKQLAAWSHPARIESFDRLAPAVGLSLPELLSILGLSGKKDIKPLTPMGLYNTVLLLSESGIYRTLIRENYGEKRKRVFSYLMQETKGSLEDAAFVEVAGSGFTQSCLADILADAHMGPIKTFYFKMDKIPCFHNCMFYNFLPGKIPMPLLIELLTRALHGQTTDYKLVQGEMRPVLKKGEEEAFRSYGLADYMDGILDFTEEYVRIVEKYGLHAEDMTLLTRYMDEMRNENRQELLDFFGDMPDSMLGWEESPVSFGPRLTGEELTELRMGGQRKFLSEYRGSCLEYSLLRCSEKEKAFLEEEIQTEPEQPGPMLWRYQATAKFPLELLGEKIVLFGAGKAGVDLYNRIRRETDSKVVLWVDNNWQNCNAVDAVNIFPVEAIKEENYDQIIITLLDKKTAGRIKKELMETGICGERILVIDYQIRWQDMDRPE